MFKFSGHKTPTRLRRESHFYFVARTLQHDADVRLAQAWYVSMASPVVARIVGTVRSAKTGSHSRMLLSPIIYLN